MVALGVAGDGGRLVVLERQGSAAELGAAGFELLPIGVVVEAKAAHDGQARERHVAAGRRGPPRSRPALLAQKICPEHFELRQIHPCDDSSAFGAPLDPQETA